MNDNAYNRAPAMTGELSPARIQGAFINRVFGWMTAALAVTGLISWGISRSSMADFAIRNQGAFMLLLIVEVVTVIALSAAINKISAPMAGIGLMFFAALNGLTLSWIFLAYTPDAIYATFFVTCGMFGGTGLFGYLTKRDLSGIGSMCAMALWGLILASIVNIFWFNRTADLVISCFGVLIFVGLTAWDMQKIKQLSLMSADGSLEAEIGRKYAVFGALTLYLDFINLFLLLLRLFGGGSRR